MELKKIKHMEKIILLLLILTLASCQIAENNKVVNPRKEAIRKALVNSYDRGNLKGKVASSSTSQYIGEVEKRKVVKNLNGGRYPVYLSKYDKTGKKIKTIVFWDNKNTLFEKSIFKYTGDQLTECKTINYDKKSKRVKESIDHRYTYDGNKVTKQIYRVTVDWIKDKEELIATHKMQFDELGRKKTEHWERHVDNDQRKTRKTFFYNNENLLERTKVELSYVDSTSAYESIRKYDKYGNITEYKNVNLEGNEIPELSPRFKGKYKYEYDDQHNWIKRIWFTGRGTIFINERKLTYYASR